MGRRDLMLARPHELVIDVGAREEARDAIPVAPVQLDLKSLAAAPVSKWERSRTLIIAALCIGLHALLLLNFEEPVVATRVEEAIPVEIIIEPAPEPPPPETAAETPPDEKPTPAPLDEKPVSDFARAADQDQDKGQSTDKEPAAAAPPPEPAASTPPPAAAPSPPVAADAEPVLPEPPPVEAPPLPTPAPTPQPERPRQQAAKPAPKTMDFAGLQPLPDLQFKAPAARRSDGPSGNAEPGYLSTLYGQIMRRMPPMPSNALPARGRVTFAVKSDGRIDQVSLAIPSGDPGLDSTAMNAVRRASPFPPPPKGGPVYIRFDYSSK